MSAANQPRPEDGRYAGREPDAGLPEPEAPAGRTAPSRDAPVPYPGEKGRSEPVPQRSVQGPYGGPPALYPGGAGPATSATARRPPLRQAVLISVVSVLVIAVLGVPLGLIWRAAAPSVPVVKTDAGAVVAQPEPEQFVAADGWFTLLGLALGTLVAVVIWYGLRRYRGPTGVIVATLGMVAAAVLAWRLGREVGLADYQRALDSASPGTHLARPPDLRAGGIAWLAGLLPVPRGALLAPAFGAAVTYTLLAAWSRYPSLQPEPGPAGLSWGSPAPRAPAAAPVLPERDAEEPPLG